MDIDKFLLGVAVACLGFALYVKEPIVKEVTIVPAVEAQALVANDTTPQIKDKHCLAVMVYGEARGESFYGKAAVAWTALNRYDTLPYNDICAVVLAKSQYVALSKPNLAYSAKSLKPPTDSPEWRESQKVAELAYDNIIPDPTKGATHFVNPRKLKHTPKWVRTFKLTTRIDNHTFYRHG